MAERSARRREIWLVPAIVWLALCALLVMTVSLAYVPLGAFNLPVSLLIAATKASLIGLIFMRLLGAAAVNRLAACSGPLWIVFLFLLMGADYFTR